MKHIDNYVSALNIRTNDPDASLFPISQGVETLAIISALQVPSVLIQVPVNIVKLLYKIRFSAFFGFERQNQCGERAHKGSCQKSPVVHSSVLSAASQHVSDPAQRK